MDKRTLSVVIDVRPSNRLIAPVTRFSAPVFTKLDVLVIKLSDFLIRLSTLISLDYLSNLY